MGIESLTEPDNIPGRQARFRYDSATLTAYEDDLKKLIALESEGNIMPSATRISSYMEDTHGVGFAPEAVRQHMQKLRRGKSLWPNLEGKNGN